MNEQNVRDVKELTDHALTATPSPLPMTTRSTTPDDRYSPL
jgi:hypothetical protein